MNFLLLAPATTVLGMNWYVLLLIILAVIVLAVLVAAVAGGGKLAKRGRRNG